MGNLCGTETLSKALAIIVFLLNRVAKKLPNSLIEIQCLSLILIELHSFAQNISEYLPQTSEQCFRKTPNIPPTCKSDLFSIKLKKKLQNDAFVRLQTILHLVQGINL